MKVRVWLVSRKGVYTYDVREDIEKLRKRLGVLQILGVVKEHRYTVGEGALGSWVEFEIQELEALPHIVKGAKSIDYIDITIGKKVVSIHDMRDLHALIAIMEAGVRDGNHGREGG